MPDIKQQIGDVEIALATALAWFRGEVDIWREISGGRVSEDGTTETIGFERGDDKNLDSFIAVLDACKVRLNSLAREVADE